MYLTVIKVNGHRGSRHSWNMRYREYRSFHRRPTGAPGGPEQYNVGLVGTHGLETSHADTFSSSISREGTLMIREVSGCENCRVSAFLKWVSISAVAEHADGVCLGGACASAWLGDFNCALPSFLYPSKLFQCDLITLAHIL